MPLLMQTDHKQTCTDTSSFNVPGVHCKWLRVTCSYIIRLISFCGLASFFCDANLMWRYFERTITQISWFELITHDAMMCQVELHRSTSDQLWHSHTSQVLFFFFFCSLIFSVKAYSAFWCWCMHDSILFTSKSTNLIWSVLLLAWDRMSTVARFMLPECKKSPFEMHAFDNCDCLSHREKQSRK